MTDDGGRTWLSRSFGFHVVKEEALRRTADGGLICPRSSVVCCPISVLCRPGDDLLSHVLRQSTIGAKAFDGRVRDGIGSDRLARATRPAKDGVRRTEIRRSEDRSKSVVSVLRRLTSERSKTGFRDGRRNGTEDDPSSVIRRPRALSRSRALATRAIKSNERLVPVSFTRCRASTSGLSTWWSSTALQGELVLRLVSRLDAFSGYPFHI